ncbi:hypothetical protein ABK040_013854 [Willaertia magna]
MESVLSFVENKIHQTFKLYPSLLQHSDTLILLKNIMSNIIKNYSNENIRKIKLSNQKFNEKIVQVEGAFEILRHVGFRTDGEFIYLPNEIKLQILDVGITIIEGYEQGKFIVSKENVTKDNTENTIQSTVKLTNLIKASEEMKINDKDINNRLNYAKAIEEMKQFESYDKVIDLLNESLLTIENNDLIKKYNLLYRIASIQYTQQNFIESIKTIQKCQEIIENNEKLFTEQDISEFHHLYACILVGCKKPLEGALEFDKSLKYTSSTTYKNTLRQKCNTLTTFYFELYCNEPTDDNYNTSIKELLNILENVWNNHEHALLCLAMIYQKHGEIEKSIHYYRKLVEECPDSAEDGIMQAKDYAKRLLSTL